MIPKALDASKELSAEGIDVEIIDPRTLVPLDKELILESVSKTEHVVIVQEAVRRGGVASDIASIIMEEAFDYLDAPVRIVAGKNTAIPYNLNLEQSCIPSKEDIKGAVRQVLYSEKGVNHGLC
jgi:pyruvate dehydrogenase E1 component beta subunit